MCRRCHAALVAVLSVFVLAASAGAEVPSGILIDVSCTAPDACVAVGTDLSNPIEGRTLAEAWNGESWTAIPTPNAPGMLGNDLYGVSCTSATACMAVGGTEIAHGTRPLAERWDGATWRIVPTPRPPGGDTGLSNVSCSVATSCVATGFAIFKKHNNAIAEQWNGRTWRLKIVPRPRGTTYSRLDHVSCPSRACVAVGSYQTHGSSKSKTLTESWRRGVWRITPSPNPPSGVNGTGLTGVSCRSALSCVAVGGYGEPLIERLSGTSWRLSKAARGPAAPLEAVSCTSANACMAVGNGPAASVQAQAWDGAAWALTPISPPQGAAFASLTGVSCGAPASCLAVGSYATDPLGNMQSSWGAVWNGAAWTVTPAP